MKTKLLIIISITIAVIIYLPIHYYYPFLGIGTTTGTFIFCEEGFVQSGNKCVPNSIITEENDSMKQEILTQLRKGPQNVNGTAQEFIVSEALSDKRVWDLLKDTKYQVNCCTYTLDGNKYPYPLYVGVTFQLNEKDMYVTAGYDLQQEKITSVEIQEGIRTSGVVPFEPESQSTIQFKAKQLGIDNIMEATDSEELSYDEKREYIKFQYGEDGPAITPSLNLRIKDLTRNLEYGQLPTFTLIEAGYANQCTAPKLEVYFIKEEIGHDLENDELIFEHRLVYSCPKFDKFSPVLNYWSEQDFPLFPACVNEGRYLIVGDSGTERVALDEYYCNPK